MAISPAAAAAALQPAQLAPLTTEQVGVAIDTYKAALPRSAWDARLLRAAAKVYSDKEEVDVQQGRAKLGRDISYMPVLRAW